jgi:hypothetical protein
MSKAKHPYYFGDKSRAAMTDFICSHKSHHGVLSFNVKAHNVNWERPKGDYGLDPALDAAWDIHLQSKAGEYVSQWAFDDASRHYSDGEYTSYPGNDQGDWQFYFEGRQGGWLTLHKWRGWKMPRYVDDLREFCDGLDYKTLRKFYVGVSCMAVDFTPANASANVESAVNFIRWQWEEDKREEQEAADSAMAERTAAERPDLAPQYEMEGVY